MRAKPIIGIIASSIVMFAMLTGSQSFGETPADIDAQLRKLDARISELNLIIQQEDQIIRGYTKNRTQGVREGSQEFYACQNAANRIKMAQAEIQKIPAQKSALKDKIVAQEQQRATKEIALSEEMAEKARKDEELRKLNELKITAKDYNRNAHGPKVKNLFLGMSMRDFCARAKELTDDEMVIDILSDGSYRVRPTKIDALKLKKVSKDFSGIFGTADSAGLINSFTISPAASKMLFKAQHLKFDEFRTLFEKGYDVKFDSEVFQGDNGLEDLFKFELSVEWSFDEAAHVRTITPEGALVRLWENFGVEFIKTPRPDEIEKAFD